MLEKNRVIHMNDEKDMPQAAWPNRNIWAVITFAFAGLSFWSEYVLIAYAGFLVFSITDIWYNRKKLFSTVYRVLGMGAVTGVAFFTGKVLALKYFNVRYGILPEYLNYSVTVFAWYIAITWLLSIIMISGGIIYLLTVTVKGLVQYALICVSLGFHKSKDTQNVSKELPDLIHLFSAFTAGMFLLAGSTSIKNIDKAALWLDAYQNSDCGEYVALRRDSRHCYRFTKAETFPFVDFHLSDSQKD